MTPEDKSSGKVGSGSPMTCRNPFIKGWPGVLCLFPEKPLRVIIDVGAWPECSADIPSAIANPQNSPMAWGPLCSVFSDGCCGVAGALLNGRPGCAVRLGPRWPPTPAWPTTSMTGAVRSLRMGCPCMAVPSCLSTPLWSRPCGANPAAMQGDRGAALVEAPLRRSVSIPNCLGPTVAG